MTLLFLKSYGFYSCAFITEALQPHESCFFNDIERYFTKSARYSWSHDVTDFLFSFHNGPFAGLICLEWWAARAAALNLWCTLSKSAFSFNVMTFLFLGSISSITNGSSYGSPGTIQRLWYCTKHNEHYTRIATDHFLLWHKIYWRDKLLTQRWLASHDVPSENDVHLEHHMMF